MSAAEMAVDLHGIGGARITILTKLLRQHDLSGSLLSKRIALVDGRIVSDGLPCLMASGDAEVVRVPTPFDLAKVIAAMGSDNALGLGCASRTTGRRGRHRALNPFNNSSPF
jgi:hypothetical protein